MTAAQFVILLVIGLSVFLLCILFHFKNNKLKLRHSEIKRVLQNQIAKNQNQINLRQSKLGIYNFLTYNLDKVLIVQSEIII